ncbi:protein lava lamp-like [Schistocerca serialis cubense]|uniref:protein lava lamp-like n=1 Tax=Schistocerca serialis cubense TaxID=2023355 RepID=UPI00214ECE1D|nr:protein lava lamp-like [Schistocerca serialis cubense]
MWWSESSDPPGDQTQAPAQNVEVKELQDQFEQQQTLIAQLKEMLRKNEQQLVTKEKEVEEYATKLSGIKSRVSKRGRAKVEKTEATVSESVPDAVQQDVATADAKDEELKSTGKRKVQRGNLILLRKQLEENRIKCEQRNKEVTKNKRGIEEMVEHLRSQLEEREQTIQELKGEFNTRLLAAASLTHTVPTAEVTQSFEIPEGMSPEHQIQELHSQISLRDNRITELNGKIIELENTIIDLQENLKEKDSVIEARTKAITLMSEDLSRKSKATLDTLDETREEMRTMQQNFVALEANMKREKEDLNKQLEAKNKRLQQMEDRNKMLESTRFELSTRNAELQEKVVLLQSELQKQSEENHLTDNVRALEEALEKANNEISSLKSVIHENKIQQSNEDIELLHQRIAELEEDKGNLQLHLVDFDDLKGSEDLWKQKVIELEDRVKQQNLDLDSHLHALSLIESEKLDLIQALQEKSHATSSLEAKVADLQQIISETENCKVTAELKAVELEEQVDMLLKQKDDLASELENMKTALVQFHNQPLKNDEQFSNQFHEKHETWDVQELSEKEEKDSSNLEISLKPLESELEHARKTIAEQREIISELNEKLRQREEEMELQLEIISKLENLGDQVQEREESNEDGNKISEIVKELGEMAGDLNEWKKRCSEVEDRLEQLGNEKVQLERHLEEVINENQVISTQLRFQKEISEELEARLSEQYRILATRDEAINKLKDTVKEQQKALESKDVALLDVSQKLQELEQEVDKQHQELAAELMSRTQELEKVNSEYLELKLTFNDKEQEVNSLNILMQNLSVQVDDVINRIGLGSIDVNNSICRKLEVALSVIGEKCVDLISENQMLIGTTEQNNTALKEMSEKLSYMEKVAAEFEENFEIQKKKDDELSNVKEDLARKLDELSNKDKTISELEQKITEQISKNKKLAKCLKAKAVVVRNYEEKEKLWEAANQSKEEEAAIGKSLQENISAQQESEILSLHKQLQEKDDDLRKYSHKCSELENEISNLTQTCAALQQQLQLVSEERNNTSCIMQEMSAEMKEREEKINSLMKDINKLQEELTAKDVLKNELTEENKNILMKRVELENELVELHGKLSLMETDATKKSNEVETLIKVNAEKDAKLLDLQLQLERLSSLEESAAQKNARIADLEEQISSMSENYQMTSSAMEAKLQEREAYLEALEQELTKSRERAAHLEEGLCNMEERRRSLEVKFETLKDMLMEADRKKEEVEESEEILEAQISNLMRSVETFKKRLYETEEENGDLSRRICEMKDENESLQKSLLSAEMTTKSLQKDVERLSSFEVSYTAALEKIESLEIELKQSATEYAHNLKAISEQEKLHRETLESDLKSLSHQLEISENEKRYINEQLEKLNDVKVTLEDEIESLNENLRLASSRISELEEERKFNSSADNQPSERSAVSQLFTDHQKIQQETDPVVTDDEKYNDSKLCKEEYIKNLSAEIDKLKTLLSQKDNELHTYQQRLLQLQFGSNQGVPSPEVCGDAFSSVNKNTSRPSFQEARSDDMSKSVSELNEEIDILKSDLLKSQEHIEELKCKVCLLENEVKDKEAKLQQSSNSIEELLQFKDLCVSYQQCISDLKQERYKIYQELIKSTAESEVSEIINKAVECVNMKETEHLPHLQNPSAFTGQQPVDEPRPTGEEYRLLTDKLKKLEIELEVIKTERDKALEKIELNVNSSLAAEHSFSAAALDSSDMNQRLSNVPEPLEIDGMPEEAVETYQRKSFVFGLHYSPLEPTDTVETVDDDDGWGWSANEARLEEEHMQKQQETFSAVDANTFMKTHVADLEKQVRELESEKTKLSEELQAAQIRNGKLLKKLKDFKLKNENLMRENQELALKTADGFCNLDSAIEEELKIQIDTLEKELKEYKNEREATKVEKESLLKQIDVLTSANERFLEMKEKQDIEVEMRERKNRELSNEIEGLHWKISELIEEKSAREAFVDNESLREKQLEISDNSKIDELEQQIAALAADNENLQMLLEEQRNLRLQIENVCRNNVSVGYQNAEIEELKLDYEKVKEQYDKACTELNRMSADIQKYITIENEYKQCLQKLSNLEKENIMLIDENQKIVSDLNVHCREKEDFQAIAGENNGKIQELALQKEQLEEQNLGLSNECSALRHELYSLQEHIQSLNTTLDFLKTENVSLNEKLSLQIIERKTDTENLSTNSDTKDDKQVVKLEKETETESTYLKKSILTQTLCTYMTLQELENKVETLATALNEKTSELEAFQLLLESDRNKHFISEKDLNIEIERLRNELQKQNEILQERDMKNLETSIQQTSDTENVTKVKTQLAKVIQDYEEMLAEKKQEICQLQTLLQNKEETSLHLSHKQLEEVIAAKENDIMELQTKLLEKEQKFEECLYEKNQDVENERQRIYETERQMESLIFAKDEDIQNLRIVLAEKERTSNELLCVKEEDIKNLKIKIADKDEKIGHLTEKLHAELLKVSHLEQKVAELEQKVALHELEYQSFRLQQAETASDVSDMAQISNDSIAQEMAEGKQNELDVALYMLHQRDVRCDELTLELMQLLEERDTLQLRLSNALKVNEDLRNKLGKISATSTPVRSVSLSSPHHSLLSGAASLDQSELVQVGQTPVPPQSEEAKEDLQALADKLSQLHSVDYRRDVTLKDESEQRHSEQIQLLQHRGSGIVLDASYTLSRDVQSPSTVLLNWIRGRSTPKVMHI